MASRPGIPPAVKREVRQRCGFGCVICGLPMYEYDHMIDWADTHRHVAEEITLLCRLHHGEKTDGLLPLAKVIEANKNPYNFRSGVTKNYLLHYSGDSVKVSMGGSSFSFVDMPNSYCFAPIVIDEMPMIMFTREQGNLFLSFTVFDEFNRSVVQVLNNEIIFDAGQWDVEWVGLAVTVREAKGKILLKFVFDPPNEIIIERGRLLRNGVEVLIGTDYIYLSNSSGLFGGVETVNCPVGISIGDPVPECGGGLAISQVPRYMFDRKEARKKLRRKLSEMRKATK